MVGDGGGFSVGLGLGDGVAVAGHCSLLGVQVVGVAAVADGVGVAVGVSGH